MSQPVYLVDEEQVGRVVDPPAPRGEVVDDLGDRGLGPPQAFRLAREPVVTGEGPSTFPIERPPGRGDRRPRLLADGLEDQVARPPAQPGDLVLDPPRGVDDRRDVQDAAVARDLIGPEGGAAGLRVG